MLENAPQLLPNFGNYLATYLLHSTVLLGGAWFVLKVTRTASHALREHVWKLAAMLGLLTPLLQLAVGVAPVIDLTLREAQPTSTTVEQVAAKQGDSEEIELAMTLPVSITPRETADIAELKFTAAADEIANTIASHDPREELDGEALAHWTVSQPRIADATVEDNSNNRAVDDEDAGSRISAATAGSIIVTDEPFLRRMLFPVSLTVTLLLVVSLLRMLWHSWLFHRRLHHCIVATEGVAKSALDSLLTSANIRRRVALLESPNYVEPVSCGILRWRIVVPNTLEARLTRAEIRAVLAHELAHLVRGDTIWLTFGRWLCTCFAIQPLNFLARREWRRAAEYQCDDWAVGNRVNALTLARCLTVVAEWRMNEPPCATTLAVGGAKSDLTGRVERLVGRRSSRDPWPTRFRRLATVVSCFIAAGTLVAWGPRTILFAGNVDGDEVAESATVEVSGRENTSTAIEQETMQDELTQLEHELDLLEREMQELNELLHNSNFPGRVRVLARRLSERMQQLQDRRELLKRTYAS